MFKKTTFRKKPDPYEQERIDDILKEVGQKKLYIPMFNHKFKMLKLLKQRHKL